MFYSKRLEYTILLALAVCLFLISGAVRAQFSDQINLKNGEVDASIESLLSRATELRSSDLEKSLELAGQALHLSKEHNRFRLAGRSHSLLGRLGKDAKDHEGSKYHFMASAAIYETTGDVHQRILDTMEFAKLFFVEKKFEEGYEIIEGLLPLAYEYEDPLPLARLFEVRSKALYQQKRYVEAIKSYTDTINNLTGQDDDTQRRLGSAYHQMAQIYKRLKDYQKMSVFHQYALDVHTALGDQKRVVRSTKNVAQAELKQRNYLLALDFLLRGLDLQKKIARDEDYAELLVIGGAIYRYLNRYETSLEFMTEANEIYRLTNNHTKIADSSNQIGYLYTRLGQFNDARVFYEQSIQLPKDKVQTKTLAAAYREIAVIDFEIGKYQEALEMALRAHAIYQALEDNTKGSVVSRVLGQIYLGLNQPDLGLRYLRESKWLAEQAKDNKLTVKALNTLGSALVERDWREASSILTKSLEIATQANLRHEKKPAHEGLMRIAERRGLYQEAFKHAQDVLLAVEFIHQEQERNKLTYAKAQLDSYITEKELESLRSQIKLDEMALEQQSSEIEIVRQANKISELELTKNRYTNFSLVVLLILCLAVAVYIFRGFISTTKKNKELDFLAMHDALTSCHNRRALFQFLNRDFSNIQLFEHYCVIMADLDHFKEINDTHGHAIGDMVLIGIAKVIKDCVRKSDITARYGGEEFCIVLPGASAAATTKIADTIRETIEHSNFGGISLTCSFGISSIEHGAETPTKLISQADKALYHSKTEGRNRVSVWNEDLS